MLHATRTPLFWVSAIVALLVLGLVAFASLASLAMRDKTLADEMDNLAWLSLSLAESTQRVMFRVDLLASSLEEQISRSGVRTPEDFRRYAATKAMHDVLHDRITLAPDIDSFLLVDGDGVLINTSRTWPSTRVDLSDREYFTTLRENPDTGYVISAPLKNRLTGQETIFFARRVNGPDAAFLGLVLASMAKDRFEKLFDAVLPGDGTTIALYRRDGVLLAREPQSEGKSAPGQRPAIQRFFRETMARSEQGTLHTRTIDTGAAAQLIAMHTVRGYPLMINVSSSEAVVLAGWWNLAKLIFAVAAAAIVLVVLLGFVFFRQWRMQDQMVETAQQLARANRDLAAANEGLESFTYSVAHDLRSPLRGIAGYSTLLLRESRDQLDEESAYRLDRINAGAMRMGVLIDDLLQLSRIARAEMKRRDFDLGELARGVAASLTEAHPARRVQFVVQPDMRANGDPNLVKIVLENLIGNAWKFTSRTDAARIEVGAEEGEDGTSYFVRDNGAGFDMRYSGKLFKAFQRLHRADEFEGIGIGLSIVHRIVMRHGGKVWAESEPGKETVFRFTLWTAP
jgi:signal transduction histidine kinase